MERKLDNRVGESFIDNKGESFTIITYNNANDCAVRYKDGTIVEGRAYQKIRLGCISNPNKRTTYDRGYIGQGFYNSKKDKIIYNIWKKMFERCYNENLHLKMPSYKECEVIEEWYNFQNFAKWFEENYVEGWHLDKDIILKGNKTYSPETCCFVPNELNALIKTSKCNKDNLPKGLRAHGNKYQARLSKYGNKVNLGLHHTPEEAFQAYKTAKEKYIKEVADKWKGKIDDKVYKALYNYKVEITD